MSKYMNQGDIPTVQIYNSDVKEYKIRTSLDSILGTRKNQQDSAFVQSEKNLTVGIVCDGMGGLNAGEVASQMAVTQFIEDFYRAEGSESRQRAAARPRPGLRPYRNPAPSASCRRERALLQGSS